MSPEPHSVAEVRRLHSFFEDWFTGRGDRDIREFSDAMAPGFTIVMPSGRTSPREAIVGAVESAAGRGSMSIEIAEPEVRYDDGIIAIVAYEEHQAWDGGRSSRQSTAVMRRDDRSPGGWEWLLVHETWIEPPDQASTPSSR